MTLLEDAGELRGLMPGRWTDESCIDDPAVIRGASGTVSPYWK
jgi:hypothetical protein